MKLMYLFNKHLCQKCSKDRWTRAKDHLSRTDLLILPSLYFLGLKCLHYIQETSSSKCGWLILSLMPWSKVRKACEVKSNHMNKPKALRLLCFSLTYPKSKSNSLLSNFRDSRESGSCILKASCCVLPVKQCLITLIGLGDNSGLGLQAWHLQESKFKSRYQWPPSTVRCSPGVPGSMSPEQLLRTIYPLLKKKKKKNDPLTTKAL